MATLIVGIILVGVSTAYTMYCAFSYFRHAVPKILADNKHASESRSSLN